MDFLKQQAANAHHEIHSTQKQQLVNSCLRDKAQSQEADIARVRSALANYTVLHWQTSPDSQEPFVLMVLCRPTHRLSRSSSCRSTRSST